MYFLSKREGGIVFFSWVWLVYIFLTENVKLFSNENVKVLQLAVFQRHLAQ